MNPEIRSLLDLQEIDKEIAEVNAQLAKYPAIWETTKQKVVVARKRVDSAKKAEVDYQSDRRRTEAELRILADTLRKYRQQEGLIKTQKDYQAHNAQVDAVRQKVAQLEEHALSLLGSEETIKKEIVDSEADLQRIEEAARQERTRIRTQVDEKKARLEGLKRDRENARAVAGDKGAALYERINRRWPGNALVPVRLPAPGSEPAKGQGASCSGCNFRLLGQELVELRKGDELLNCDNCGRILYIENPIEAGTLG